MSIEENGASAEQMVMFELVAALVATHPEPKRVHIAFLNRMSDLLNNAPAGADPEYLVEVRARMAQYSVILNRMTLPSEEDTLP